jgi:hypothetical protein
MLGIDLGLKKYQTKPLTATGRCKYVDCSVKYV